MNNNGRTTILVVDDEQDILKVLYDCLDADDSLRVLCCDSPRQALHLAETHHIDLLLTDVVMPVMLGVELAQRMAERHPMLKVLLMSGYSDQMPNYPLLRKPFHLADLMKAVHNLIGRT